MENNLKTIALEVIEIIATEIGYDTKEKILVDRKDIEDIYCFAHLSLGKCDNPHKDWKKKLIEIHKEMKDRNII